MATQETKTDPKAEKPAFRVEFKAIGRDESAKVVFKREGAIEHLVQINGTDVGMFAAIKADDGWTAMVVSMPVEGVESHELIKTVKGKTLSEAKRSTKESLAKVAAKILKGLETEKAA